MSHELARQIRSALYGHRHGVALVGYGAVAAVAYLLALLVRFDVPWSFEAGRIVATTVPMLIAVRVACSRAFRLSAARLRFAGIADVVRLVLATTTGSVVFYLATRLLPFAVGVPESVIAIEWLLTTYLTASVWIAYRIGFERIRRRRAEADHAVSRVLIVGAGVAGARLAHEMHRLPTGYRVVGFVDDDPLKRGTSVHGIDVVGGSHALATLADSVNADRIAIAIPSAAPAEFRRVVERCEQTGLPFRVLPGIQEVLAGEVRVSQLREVELEDLLGRRPVKLELPEVAADLAGERVLITGAAGSIGAELARQVARYDPAELILLDQAETPLFYLQLELRERFPDLALVLVVGDIVEPAVVERVLTEHRPGRIFHAAAYKHVLMMEVNASEAVRNNVIGTWRLADAAGRYGTEKFVLVSTDKAVRPKNVMGATKRLAEQVVVELKQRYPATAYNVVRFGNVLGSNGSVVAIFKRQIAERKPLTVTHPEATRYFMTIPEAVQLILQASALPELRGRITLLEMGEPVRILDLAESMVRSAAAAGRHPPGIVFTGLRPGEKLHEELVDPEERTLPTSIAKVRLLEPTRSADRSVVAQLPRWEQWLEKGRTAAVLGAFARMFPDLENGESLDPSTTEPPVVVHGN